MQLEATSSGLGSTSAPATPGELQKEWDKHSSAVQLVVFVCWCAFALISVLAISGCESRAETTVPVAMNSFKAQDSSTPFAQEKLNARMEELPAQF